MVRFLIYISLKLHSAHKIINAYPNIWEIFPLTIYIGPKSDTYPIDPSNNYEKEVHSTNKRQLHGAH